MHPLWFYKHQHDNRVLSKLFVACQRLWFQWRFWFVPSVPEYLPEEEEHKPDPWRNPIEINHMGLHLENGVAVVKIPTIISNNPVLEGRCRAFQTTDHTLFRYAVFGMPLELGIVLWIAQCLITLGSSNYFKAAVLTFWLLRKTRNQALRFI